MTSANSILYDRYMDAARLHREHAATCAVCTGDRRCVAGARLFTVFSGLQDQYLHRRRG
ncbi:hypothetical protein [Streptomyces uncialis]|uniref:hypothetical protein n=1 Tax=Streptomyces uncialis TaxID=1048205 RepID=UPI002F951BE2|nr:hypothetical protein OG924_37175 [Streptomyces uncialis]